MIITQMFFDADVYIQFVKDCRAIGITVPILPGIMCVQHYAGFKRMLGFCKTRVPDKVHEAFESKQVRKLYDIYYYQRKKAPDSWLDSFLLDMQ